MQSRCGADESVSRRVVREVAAAEGVAALELAPLFDAVDPDALDALYEGGFDGTVQFRYEGYAVTVSGDGTVSVAEADEQPGREPRDGDDGPDSGRR